MGMTKFDEILKEVGKYGHYQIYVAVLTGLGFFLLGMQTLGNVFLSGIPAYWCGQYDTEGNYSTVLPWNSSMTQAVLPQETNKSECGEIPPHLCQDPCDLRLYTDSKDGNWSDYRESGCRQWMYDRGVYGSTVVTKWDLVCSSEWLVALGQSTYMVGFTIGSITLGNLSDILGRKLVWLGSMTLLFFSAVGAAFMPNYWAFIALRTISGVAVGGVLTTGFVLVIELTGSLGRIWGSIICQATFALGYMSLSGIAYLIRDFRYLQLTTGLIAVLFLPYIWILDESPRWLIVKERYDEAAVLLKRMAKMNKTDCPEELLDTDKHSFMSAEKNEEQIQAKKNYSIITVFKYPRLRWRAFNICFNWFVNSFVYYGLSLGSADLLGGPYLNLFLSGLMEFPGLLLCAVTVNKLGRQRMLFAFLMTAGSCCFGAIFLNEDKAVATVVLSLLGKLCISGSFCIVYVHTAELFPTVVRNLLVGAGCTFARIGGSVAPFVLLTAHSWKPLPMLCFGAASLVAGLWSLALPETLRQKLPDTLTEGEEFGKQTKKLTCIKCTEKQEHG